MAAGQTEGNSMKNYAATFICALAIAFPGVTIHSVGAQSAPVIPSWIHSGLIVIYDGESAFVKAGKLTPGAAVVVTTQITASDPKQVSGNTQIQSVGAPIGQKHNWTCDATEHCTSDLPGFSGVFWVDPANPTASIRGPNGEQYAMKGNAPYTRNGKTWAATSISYENPANGVQYACIFEAKTGLYLAYSESTPAGQVHTYFRSMSGE